MKALYVGNFEPEHSSESHIRKALSHNKIDVTSFQENNYQEWPLLPAMVKDHDFVLWTRTGWNPPVPPTLQYQMLSAAKDAGVPVVGFHLDKWWDLKRVNQVYTEPFFRSDLVITADGGHEEQFKAAGVNHHWLAPGVSLPECQRTPVYRPELAHEIIFCGSWNEYHPEWSYRLELCNWLRRTYGDRVAMYPRLGQHALRGQDLVDLYHSSKVMVGDSCLVGNATHYWSDRIPETLGRGGFLIHPKVVGMDDHYTDGEHLVTYNLGDFTKLKELIDHYVDADEERQTIAQAGKDHVLETATYEVRMAQVVEILRSKGMIS